MLINHLSSPPPFQTDLNWHLWLGADLAADLLSLLDVVLVKARVMYLDPNGVFETDKKAMLIVSQWTSCNCCSPVGEYLLYSERCLQLTQVTHTFAKTLT